MKWGTKLQIMFACAVLALPNSGTRAAEGPTPANSEPVLPDADLQALLDRGQNLQLEPGRIYTIKKPLLFKTRGQTISTRHATRISEYAVLQLAAADCVQLINGNQMADVVLENVVLDGNRYALSDDKISKHPGPLAYFGGQGAKRQTIRRCVFTGTRTWSTLQLHEGADDLVVESNIFLGAGADPRGNGRDVHECAFSWADGISCAARRTQIRNNLLIDITDGAIVLFGAPGSVVEDNVIAAISRETLGAINMVDPIGFYAIAGDKARSDYHGLLVRNNLIDARGARIHIAVPMGGAPWAPKNKDYWLVGATVTGNTIIGGAAAYGFVASGVEDFVVTNNTSSASYSGIGEGTNPAKPPDNPGPFLYTPAGVRHCTLQDEFVASQRHLMHLLRCNHGPTNALGYRVYPYGGAEAEAVVKTAYLEMLGRFPEPQELAQTVARLQTTQGIADQIRRALLMSAEFTSRHGFVAAEDLQLYRQRLWLAILDQAQNDLLKQTGAWPSAKQLYETAIRCLAR